MAKVKRISPTQRTLALLRSEGMLCEIVEKWNPHARCRQDLFGFIDILAIARGITWGIQCTTIDHMANRATKIRALFSAETWLKAGNQIQVIGWAKRGPRGARKLWTCNRHMITLEDLRDAHPETP